MTDILDNDYKFQITYLPSVGDPVPNRSFTAALLDTAISLDENKVIFYEQLGPSDRKAFVEIMKILKANGKLTERIEKAEKELSKEIKKKWQEINEEIRKMENFYNEKIKSLSATGATDTTEQINEFKLKIERDRKQLENIYKQEIERILQKSELNEYIKVVDKPQSLQLEKAIDNAIIASAEAKVARTAAEAAKVAAKVARAEAVRAEVARAEAARAEAARAEATEAARVAAEAARATAEAKAAEAKATEAEAEAKAAEAKATEAEAKATEAEAIVTRLQSLKSVGGSGITSIQENGSKIRELLSGGNYMGGTLIDKVEDWSKITEDSDDYFKQKQQKENFVKSLDDNPVYSPKNKELTSSDRITFIISTYFIRLIVLFILEWSVNSHYITTFRDAYIDYVLGYLAIFALWVILANINENPYEENILLSTLFYCVNYKDHKMNKFHIFIHALAQIILLPLLYIIKFKSKPIDQDSFEQKQTLIKAISNFTFLIWIITSLIATRF